ncbi:hypothetical protein M4578_25375 [Salipiger sp. P9]|uniref:hypothetical protein n=1 Tax=Salipiger pentaromativorans TaxID=2943193 RepID=UPI00215786AB|nr:hypothetical protein [Salipiger pentaromativorans]MCR8551161.1 hypothetical protein [Salipiger pentaromativorans]
MSTGNGFCLAAIILAVLGAVVPGVGLFLGWGGLVLATIGAWQGATGMAVAVVALSAVVFWLLTPSLWVEAMIHRAGFVEVADEAPMLRIVSIGLLVAPLVAIAIRKKQEGARQ